MGGLIIERKPPKIPVQGATHNFLSSGILLQNLVSFPSALGGLYIKSTAELTRGSLIILAADTQSLLFSPMKLLFEHSFMLAWARETHSAPDWGSAWVSWSSDSEGKHLPKPHGFLQLFPYSSKFWNVAICPKWESWRLTRSLFGRQSWGESSGAFSDFLFPGSFIFQRKKKIGLFPMPEKLFLSLCSSWRGGNSRSGVTCSRKPSWLSLGRVHSSLVSAHRATLCSLFLSLTVSYPALLCTQLPHSLDFVLFYNWDSILSSIVSWAFRTMSTI